MSHPERIVPDETPDGILALHLKRYDFAAPWCHGRDVLDAACGVGYGSAHLARVSRSVLGVDRSSEAVAYARERYAAANLSFEEMDVAGLTLADGTFDTVCCFETIEHVADGDAVVAEAARVLRDNGVFIVSTPQAAATTRAPENPFHEVEYSRADFEALLGRHFGSVELYGQRRQQTRRHRLLQRLDVLGLRRRLPGLRLAAPLVGTRPTTHLDLTDILIDRSQLDRATELVAVCRLPLRG